MVSPIRVGILVFDDVDLLDVTGPKEVFAAASKPLETTIDDPILQLYERESLFDVDLISVYDQEQIITADGLRLVPDTTLHVIDIEEYTTLVIPGGRGIHFLKQDEKLVELIRKVMNVLPNVLSVCTGAYLCAQTGLLDNKQITTHHHHHELFQIAYPDIEVIKDVRVVEVDNLIFSSGVTAGIDGAMEIVTKLIGPETATHVKSALNLRE